MKNLSTFLGITLLCSIYSVHSQLFEYDCTSVAENVGGALFYVDDNSPLGVLFYPLIDGKFNRISLPKNSFDLNGTAYLFEGAVLSPDDPNPLASVDFFNSNDTDLLTISFDSVDVVAGTLYTVFITVDNSSLGVFYEGIATNSSAYTVYGGYLQPYPAAHEMCIRYTVADPNQDLSSDGKLSKSDVATIVAAVGVPLGSLIVASCVVLLRHGLTSKTDEESPSEKTEWKFPKFPKTTRAELKQIKKEEDAPSSNEGSEREDEIDEGESSNSE